MTDNDLTTLRVRIEGFVQGVGFRHFATLEARKLGLDGWVRNRSDRTVEALVSGGTKAVESFVAACMKGPEGCLVKNIDLFREEPPAEKGFRQRATI
jgi:acylphosphatase